MIAYKFLAPGAVGVSVASPGRGGVMRVAGPVDQCRSAAPCRPAGIPYWLGPEP